MLARGGVPVNISSSNSNRTQWRLCVERELTGLNEGPDEVGGAAGCSDDSCVVELLTVGFASSMMSVGSSLVSDGVEGESTDCVGGAGGD